MPVDTLRCRDLREPSTRPSRAVSASAASARSSRSTTGTQVAAEVDPRAIEAGPRSLWRYAPLLPAPAPPDAAAGPGLDAARARAAARSGASASARCCLKLDHREPDPLVQGPRRRGRGGEGAPSSGLDTLVVRLDRATSANAVAARAAASGHARRSMLLPGRARAGEAARDRRSTAATMYAVSGSYDDCSRLVVELAGEVDWAFVNVNLRSYYAEGSKTLAFEIAEQLGWQTPDAVVSPIASGALFTKLWQGFEQFRRLGLVDGEQPAASTAARPRAAPRSRTRSPRSGRVSPVRPELDRAFARDRQPRPTAISRSRPRAGVGRRRSTPSPRTRSARTWRCSPRRRRLRRDARPASTVGALRAAVARGEIGARRPRRRARHRHRPEDAAGSSRRAAGRRDRGRRRRAARAASG